MTYHFYCVPGLGFNDAIYSNLQLEPHKQSFLNWIEPLNNESIESYARRMSEGITEGNEEDLILIGHSFGGVMVQEIAKIKRVKLVILISSVKTRDELSRTLRIVDFTRAYFFFNKRLILNTFRFYAHHHGFTDHAKKNLFREMVHKNTDHYLQWALKTIASWRGNDNFENMLQIHGEKDAVFPVSRIHEPFVMIDGGNHIMLLDKADKIKEIIFSQLYVLSLMVEQNK